jgi:hypothetical protein
MKRFFIKSRIAYSIVILLTGIVSFVTMQSCSGDSDFNETNMSETISVSIEFENYLVNYFTFTNECVTIINFRSICK